MKFKDLIKSNNLIYLLVFPITVFYYETVFCFATTGGFFTLSTFFVFLFSAFFGGVGYLLSSLSKSEKVNRIIATVLLGLTAVPYVVQFLVYKQFKIYYDIKTMFGGAGDALTSYVRETAVLIFNFGSLFVILLLAIPSVAFWLLSKKNISTAPSNAKTRIGAAITSVLCYLLSLVIILASPLYSLKYSKEYNYQSAVQEFGLLTGMRLDIKNGLFGTSNEFEDAPGSIPTGTDSVISDDDKVYGENKLNIDFERLNKGANSTIKSLNDYVSQQTPSSKNKYTGMFKEKNLIFISAEAFSHAVIDPKLTPTLYRLATKGINFTDYYQPSGAGTTGGEYQNLFGMLPMAGGQSFKNTQKTYNYYTMGSQLNRLGYYGKAYHNNTYTYYDRHLTHVNLGYSDGYMGYGNGMEKYVKWTWPQSDYEMIKGTLPTYINKDKFNIYYMSVSGHSGYSKTGNAMTKKHWDRVKDLPYSDTVKGYLAANLDLEDALTHLVSELEKKGIADDTVICISADHFPYGLDNDAKLGSMKYLSELYGVNVVNNFQRDFSRLIIWSGCLEKNKPIIVDTPTSSLDILPTLSNLFGTEYDSRFMVGRDVFSNIPALVFDSSYNWKTELGTYYSSTGKFVPKESDTEIPEGYVSTVKAVVRNKIKYCTNAPAADYFRYVFKK